MFKRRILLLALALAMVLGGIPGVSAQDASAAADAMVFADMPAESYWSFASLNAAVENGLLNGFNLDGAHYIKPEAALTRAQMATIVNRAFGAKVAATLAGVADVPSYAWYANEMAKAIHMGTFMRDTKMRPDDSITRQEAFVVLARAFVLKQNDTAPLNVFSDKAQIASWALPELSAMKAAGYIQGSGGMLHPLDTITRAEFATVMDNMVKQYIDVAGTYTEVVAEGNVIVRVPGVTLDGVDVDGDLVIGDGVGDGNAYLNNIAVSGRALIRGGGENSVVFSGSATDVRNIVISRSSDGRVRILTEEGVVLAEAEVAGDSDVILEGTFGSVTVVSDNVTVTALNATITDMSVPGEDSVVILSGTTTVKNVAISGTQSELIVQEDASVDTVEISAPSVTVSGTGTVENVEVQAGGDEASITTPNTVTTVSTGATGVTAGGEEVPAGGTATNNDSGTDATVTEPSTGGGGGGGSNPPLTPVLDIAKVSDDNGSTYITAGTHMIDLESYPLYQISAGTQKEDARIEVAITNTSAVSHTVTLTVKNGNTQVATATSSGISKAALDVLDGYSVSFGILGDLLDNLSTTAAGSYLDSSGVSQTVAAGVFSATIDTIFARMGVGDIYTVTITLTPQGGTAGTKTFCVEKIL